MTLDKTMFLILSMITIFFIIMVGILARYGSKISDNSSFNLFFNWYIALVIINLLNILVTLLFHYFMTDLPGEKGSKGKTGEKGLPGDDDRCFCRGTEASKTNQITLDETQNIHTHTTDINNNNGEIISGSIIHKHMAPSEHIHDDLNTILPPS